MQICFHMVESEVPVRLSFYYTSPEPVSKKLAKKCCSEKIEKQVMSYMQNLEKYEKKAINAGNKELDAFKKLGRKRGIG